MDNAWMLGNGIYYLPSKMWVFVNPARTVTLKDERETWGCDETKHTEYNNKIYQRLVLLQFDPAAAISRCPSLNF